MPNVKKITTFILAIIAPISLIAGYFCATMPRDLFYAVPPMAQAADTPTMGNTPACGEMDAREHYIMPNDATAGAIALCCAAKRENSDAGILSLNEWSPSNVDQPIASVDVASVVSGNQLIFKDYPISPPQAELLASVIKIE